jgi:hypothetical protein
MKLVRIPRRIPRRTLLRGAFGAALALPFLDCMRSTARAQTLMPPKRYVMTFGGFSLTNDATDAGAQNFIPEGVGAGYDLRPALAPLDGFPDANGAAVKERIGVVSGFSIPDDDSVPGGRSGGTDGFHWHCNPFLTGTRQVSPNDSTITAASSDQIVAAAIAGDTRFESLTYRVQASNYLSGASAETQLDRATLSFAERDGEIVRVTAQTSPKQAYESLFTGFTPGDDAAAAAAVLELEKRRSILDVVDRNMSGLLPRLGSWDRQRLERHYDEVRALEKLVSEPPPAQGASCLLPEDPGEDPAVGGNWSHYTGWDASGGYSQEDDRARTFNRLAHMALVCDLSRSVAMMYTMFQTFMNVYPLIGAEYNAHELNHFSTQENLDAFIAWHVGHFGDLVSLLRDTPEGDGSVLDNCVVFFMNEGGDGYGAVEGSHSTERLACLFAGGAGGLRSGEHVVAPQGTHIAQVLTTFMTAVGAPVTGLGEIQGTVSELTS